MTEKAIGNLQEFRYNLKTRPMQRSERWEVSLTFPEKLSLEGDGKVSAEKDVVLFCEEIQIPGMVIENKEINLGPWKFYRNTNVGFLGQEINMTFLTDENWGLRSAFEQWISACVDTTGKQVAYLDDISATIQIKALSLEEPHQTQRGGGINPRIIHGHSPVNKTWTLFECTPKVLNLVPLSMGTTSIVRTTLIVSAAYWESSDVPVAKGIEVNLGKDELA